jgi:Flp pilus assembly protein TadD
VAVRAVFAFLKGSQPDSAAALGMAALRRSPDDVALLVIAGEAQLVAGRPREALALARRLVLVAPGNWAYQQIAGYAAARNGRCDEAQAHLQRARLLAPAERGPGEALRRLDGGVDCGLTR